MYYHLAVTFIWTTIVFLVYLALYLFCTYGVWRVKDSYEAASAAVATTAGKKPHAGLVEDDEIPLASLSMDEDSGDEVVGEIV